MGDNGLEAVISDFEILPYEVREPQKVPFEELTAGQKKIIYDESLGFLKLFEKHEKLEWGLPVYKNLYMSYPQLSKAKNIGRLLNLASQVALHQGDKTFSIRLHLASRRLAERIDEATNVGMAFLVARAICANNERMLQKLLATNKYSSAELKQLLDDYNQDSTPVGLEPGLKGNWINAADYIATIRFPQDAADVVFATEEKEKVEFLEGFRGNKKPLDRNATAKELIEVYRAAINGQDPEKADALASASTSYLDRFHEFDQDESGGKLDLKALNEWKQKTPNSFGKYLLSFVLPGTVKNYFETRTSFDIERDLSRVAIACKLFQMQTGSYPQTLNQLRSLNMKRGIIDRFSGKPFGYDPKRKIIWSVGKDRVNDNGLDRTSSSGFGQIAEGVAPPPQTYDIVVHLP
ncbi:MAG: hypothetical protein KF824_13045 [Fimbriimonadaceae bacterium]|nr:MAG: hypothetical protein KF824_13045 [Fimbriimonadaceae bacterium]